MNDVIYAYKSANSDELEYSVKSLKNIKHGRVIVVGDKPLFDGVEHSKPYIVRWSMLSTHHDVISKIDHACNLDITDDFIFMNDDFAIMKPTEIPTAHRGTLDEHISGRRLNDGYTKTLQKTNEYLKKQGIKEPLSYELHIPIVYNKHKLKEMYATIIPMITHASPMLTRSLYGNLYNIGGERMADPKNPTEFRDQVFLSTNDKTFKNDEIGRYIKEVLCE